jgi:glucose-1-phosphate adenylyltransferase
MRDVIAMILAGGRVEELAALTQARPKAAVPFGGQYRFIDFALSSVAHSDIGRVGVLSQYRPSSLIDHLGTGEPWDLVGRGRGVKLLPPFVADAQSHWYRGTADAVYQNLHFVRRHKPRDVLVLSGDHVYRMDFRPIVAAHRKSGADLTMVVKDMDPELGRGRFGFAEVDAGGRVVGYEEKPERPRSRLASLTMYLFRAEVLEARLEENARTGTSFQLYSEVLPAMIGRDHVRAHVHPGYWSYARSVDAYHQAHMDLLGDQPPIDLSQWEIRSRPEHAGLGDPAPVWCAPGARCQECVLSPGVRVEGEVRRSVLSPGVRVEAGAVVTDSVLLHDAVVRAGARVDRAVVDKLGVIGDHAVVGEGSCEGANQLLPEALRGGVSLVGKGAEVPAGARVGRNCLVEMGVRARDWRAPELASGASLGRAGGAS